MVHSFAHWYHVHSGVAVLPAYFASILFHIEKPAQRTHSPTIYEEKHPWREESFSVSTTNPTTGARPKSRNAGMVEGNTPLSDNDWESITKGGDSAIQKWIDDQIKGKSCAVILIGTHTAGRKWIKYEIKKAWDDKKGVLGVYIHNLKNNDGEQSDKGKNPFEDLTVSGKKLSTILKTYDPPYKRSTNVYDYIKSNIADWDEDAITIRDKN